MAVQYTKEVQESRPSSSNISNDIEDEEEHIFNFSPHVRLDYEGVVKEPHYFQHHRLSHTFTPVSAGLKTCFDSVHLSTYYFLTIVFGFPLSFAWGIIFGCTNFFTVWLFHPFIKWWFSALRCFYVLTRAATRVMCDPFYQSMSLALSRISGKFRMDFTGLERVHNV